MSDNLQDEVRGELASRATPTTLNELKSKGLEKVRVIRSSQIVQLIEEAVDRALASRGIDADSIEREEVVAETQVHFRKALDQQKVLEDVEDLRQTISEMQIALQGSEARNAEMHAQLLVQEKREEKANPDALLQELKALRSDIGGGASMAPKEEGDAAGGGALEDAIKNIGDNLGREIERIGRKVGIAAVEETEADLSSLAEFLPDALDDTNMDCVNAEERKAADVSDAVARMKSLRGGS